MSETRSAADIHRSTPGFVYGVAIHSSTMKPAEHDCACPCHKAGPDARSPFCDVCHRFVMSSSPKTVTHMEAISAGTTDPYPWQQAVPDYYFITKGNTLTDELGEHFKSEKKAEARAKELNEADVIASLRVPRSHRLRFDRYRALHGDGINGWYDGESHPLTRLPKKPGRYAVESSYDGSSSWSHYETLDDVREAILGDDVLRVVDLDTGDDVPFSVTVEIESPT